MDPEAPKPEDHGDSPSGAEDPARKRVDSLTAEKPDGGSPEKPDTAGKNEQERTRRRLTEKQRIEARRARQSRRRRPVEGNPISKGLRATGFEIRRTASFIGRSIIAGLAALGPVFSALGMGLVWLIDQAGKGLKALGRLIQRGLDGLGRLALALDRIVTPHRALILVAGVAAVLLGISQFKGLGLIEIGQPGYSGIEDLARAPAIDRTTPAGVHTRILVPIAAVALAAAVVIALAGISSTARRFGRFRRLAAMVLITVGLLTLVVALLIDLPQATDTAEAALAYSGVRARLLSGFWLQLTAAVALTVTGFSLLTEPLPGKVRSRRREPRPEVPASSRATGQARLAGNSARGASRDPDGASNLGGSRAINGGSV